MAVVEHRMVQEKGLWSLWEWESIVSSGADVNSMALCGHLIAIGSLDGRVEVCDLRSLAVVCDVVRIGGNAVSVCWANSSVLVGATESEMVSWRLDGGKLSRVWQYRAETDFFVDKPIRKLSCMADRHRVAACSLFSNEVAVVEDSSLRYVAEETVVKATSSRVRTGSDCEWIPSSQFLAVIFMTWRLRVYNGEKVVTEVDVSAHQLGFRTVAPAQPVLAATGQGDSWRLCVAGGRFLQFFTSDLEQSWTLGEPEAKAEREMRDEASIGWTAVAVEGDYVFAALGPWTYATTGKRHRRKAHDVAIYCFRADVHRAAPAASAASSSESPFFGPKKISPTTATTVDDNFPNCPRLAAIAIRKNLSVREREGGFELIALDEDGFLRRSSSRAWNRTNWPGANFPVGYEKLDDNIDYEEPEDEMDVVDGVEQVTAISKDQEQCDGYATATYDEPIIDVLPTAMKDDDKNDEAQNPWLAAQPIFESPDDPLYEEDPEDKKRKGPPPSSAYAVKLHRLLGIGKSPSSSTAAKI